MWLRIGFILVIYAGVLNALCCGPSSLEKKEKIKQKMAVIDSEINESIRLIDSVRYAVKDSFATIDKDLSDKNIELIVEIAKQKAKSFIDKGDSLSEMLESLKSELSKY